MRAAGAESASEDADSAPANGGWLVAREGGAGYS